MIDKMIFKTDMADERVDEYKKYNNLSSIDGIKVVKDDSLKFASVVIVEVLNENGEKAIDKEIGKYVTIEIKEIEYLEDDEKELLVKKISEIIKSMIGDKKLSILVVGLGNYEINADCLGSKVANKIDVTRHLLKFAEKYVDSNVREISSIVPGVLGSTGIESAEIVESVVNKVKPDIVIAVDSLMSQSISRLGKTIQISNRGIVPGAGVGNNRKEIKKENMDTPVIAIGCPLVVETATIVKDCIDSDNLKDFNKKNDNNLVVMPKDIESLVGVLSKIIASSINSLK